MNSSIERALTEAADKLEAEAQALRRKARMHQHERKTRQRLRQLFETLPMKTDATKFAQANALPIETVAGWKRKKDREAAATARIRRNREIMRLAARGRTNQQIAAVVSLHPNTVSQIITKALRRSILPE